MNTTEFWETIQELKRIDSNNKRKQKIAETINSTESWKPIVSLLSGQEMENAGAKTRTLESAIAQSTLSLTEEQISERKTNIGSITGALSDAYNIHDSPSKQIGKSKQLQAYTAETSSQKDTFKQAPLGEFYNDVLSLTNLSGNELESTLATLLSTYYPPLVSFCVHPSDYSIGVKSKTICKAMGEWAGIDDLLRCYGLEPNPLQFVHNIYQDTVQTEPIVGKMFKPMAARSKKDTVTLEELQDDHIAEIKFDGNRIIIHSTGGNNPELLAHTRRLKNYTDKFKELENISLPTEEFILDCEAVAIDPETGETMSVTNTGAIRRKTGTHNIDYNIEFRMFDIIYYDGQDYSIKPYKKRRETLEKVFNQLNDPFSLSKEYTDLFEAKEKAIEEGLEGLILKDRNAPYSFKRTRDWKKYKLRMVTTDLVFAEFEEGSGRKSGSLGRVKLETADGVDVGYVGTGFSDSLSDKIWNNQDEYEGRIAEIQFDGLEDALRTPSFIRFRPNGSADTYKRLSEEIAP